MQLGQSSGGESGEHLLVVYVDVGRRSGRMVSMAKWDWVEKLEEWLPSLVESVRRDQCDIVPEGQVVQERIGVVAANGRSSWKVVVASSGGCRAIAG